MLAVVAMTGFTFTSCNNDDDVTNGGNAKIVAGDPTSMQFTVTMPRAPRTYASTDGNATDAEIELKTVNVLIYAKRTDGVFALENNGNKSLTMVDFEPVSGTPDTYKLKDANKLATTTGDKKILVAMNYPGTLPTAENTPLSDLDALAYTLSSATDLANTTTGIAMFATEAKEATLVKEGDTDYDQNNTNIKVRVKRLVAKITVQEKLVRSGGKIISEGGELTNLQFAIGNANKTIFAKQKLVGASPNIVVQDNNWSNYAAGDFFTLSGTDFDLASAKYQTIDAEGTTVTALRTAYTPENTAETFATNGENATYISVRAQYAPAFFADATGASKGPNTVAKTFWTVVKSNGSILYFDVEAEATTYQAANAGSVKNPPYTDGLCYFRAYINKNAVADASIPGNKANNYDVLRNNYYKTMINSIKAPGTPIDEGDIKSNTTIDIDVEVDPWQPVDDDYDL